MNNINLIKETKFKDILVSLRFASRNEHNITERAILAMMLSDRSETYYSKVLMNEKLDNMFGAHLFSSVFNYGKAHVIELSLSVLSSQYVEADLLSEQVEMLSDLVYKPLLNEAVFKEAKTLLRDLIDRERDNLSTYVVNESLRIAGAGFPLEVSRYGSLEHLEMITLEDIKNTYDEMIEQDSLVITVVGDTTEDVVSQLVSDHFKNHKSEKLETSYLVTNNKQETIVNKRDIPSPYFSVVYNTHTKNVGREYWTMQLMSMVLGQLPNSFLFQEVREKRSLCYFIRSLIVGYDGVMIVTSGVRDGSEDEAIELVSLQIERLKNNEVSEELFASAKRMLINSIYQTDDSNRRIVDSEYRRYILEENINSAQLIDLIESIERHEIVDIAHRLELNTVYKMVKGADHEKNR